MLSFVLILTGISVLAAAGIEYYAVSSSKTLHRWYTSDSKPDKMKGMAVSVIISLIVGALASTGAGGGVYTGMVIFLSTVIGFATNTMTYNFFLKLDKANQKRKEVTAKWHDLKETRPQVVQDGVNGFKAVVKLIGGVFVLIGMVLRGFAWLVALPNKLSTWRHRGDSFHSTTPAA